MAIAHALLELTQPRIDPTCRGPRPLAPADRGWIRCFAEPRTDAACMALRLTSIAPRQAYGCKYRQSKVVQGKGVRRLLRLSKPG